MWSATCLGISCLGASWRRPFPEHNQWNDYDLFCLNERARNDAALSSDRQRWKGTPEGGKILLSGPERNEHLLNYDREDFNWDVVRVRKWVTLNLQHTRYRSHFVPTALIEFHWSHWHQLKFHNTKSSTTWGLDFLPFLFAFRWLWGLVLVLTYNKASWCLHHRNFSQ